MLYLDVTKMNDYYKNMKEQNYNFIDVLSDMNCYLSITIAIDMMEIDKTALKRMTIMA